MTFVAEWNTQAHPFNWSTKSVAKVMAKCEAQPTSALAVIISFPLCVVIGPFPSLKAQVCTTATCQKMTTPSYHMYTQRNRPLIEGRRIDRLPG